MRAFKTMFQMDLGGSVNFCLVRSSFSKILDMEFRREMEWWLAGFEMSLSGLGSIIINNCCMFL